MKRLRILLTGARAPATLELARLGARAGYTVHVADTHRWNICRGSRLITGRHVLPLPRQNHHVYAEAVNRLVHQFDIDVVVPTCEEIFHLAAVRDQLDARVTSLSLSRLAPLHDKWQFIAACTAAGVAAPRTHLVMGTASATDLPAGRYILKPRHSRFATRVHEWQSDEPLPRLAAAPASGWIAQDYIEGKARCSWSVALEGRVLAHATYVVDATAGVRGAAIAFHSARDADVLEWVQKFVAAHRLTGQFAFDFITGPNGLVGIECNPRLTSGIHCFRGLPDVAHALFDPHAHQHAPLLQPPPDLYFRSRLALAMYGPRTCSRGASLLEAANDPWPRRLQSISWAHLLLRSLGTFTEPRALSTRDIEWNGE